ncbi:putative ResB family protein [Treponema primitia ZAS-2]|uniref:Putative ResB family protein n=1 Tax=Treponema primitia (strain ATCC BAA-887 / DSM 12427 / ZAS-2) TaxID=545694 RepID=F5YLN8_TREPZ|nr:cytochrome c biogenesis protein ResB [Treponema primitia]AEF84128.1 putative ResB family protein [Treponema primitia ZAS-2]
MVKKIFAILRSLKLTAVLIGYFIITSAVSTFIPQKNSLEGPQPRFFSSPAFLIPVVLFFINLLSCTVFRFRRELKKSKPNFGPDLLHGGLLLFIIAAFLSGFNRIDGSITLSKGQQAILPNGSIIFLDGLEYVQDENGRPQAWKSYLSVIQDREVAIESYPLEVNHPLKVGGFSLYQYSYGVNSEGEYTVLRAVWDPGYAMVVIALFICAAGICITLFVKMKNFHQGRQRPNFQGE